MCAPCLHRKVLLFPFQALESGSLKSSLCSWREEFGSASGREKYQRQWIYVYLRTTKAINKYLGGVTFEAMQLPVFSLNICSLILTVTGGSCLQQLLLWCSNDTFYFSHCLIGILLYRRAFPFLLCIYLYGLMGVYSLVFNPILYY